MQHLGLVSIILVVCAGFYTMRRWPMERRRSFSENIARDNLSRLLFGSYMTVVTLLFYTFLLFWLGPSLGVGSTYYILTTASLILQLVLSWVPATTGRSMSAHNTAAYGIALIMPVVVAVILLTAAIEISIMQMIISWIFILFAAVIFFLFLFVPTARKNFLYFQLTYFVGYWLVMLAFTYL